MTDRSAHVAVVVVLVLVSVLGPPVVAEHQTGTPHESTPVTTPHDPAPPGERFQGALGIQVAEVEGEMETRQFGVSFETSDSNASKAAVVAEQTAHLEERLAELHRQRRATVQARDNGSITRGEYRARVATLAARTRTIERLANRTRRAASSLPAESRAERGIDLAAIRELSSNASELSGGETAEIARNLAGASVGRGLDASNRPTLPEPAAEERRENRSRERNRAPTERDNESRPTNDSAAEETATEEERSEETAAEEERVTSTPTRTPADETPLNETENDTRTPAEETATDAQTPLEETRVEETASTPTPTPTPREETPTEETATPSPVADTPIDETVTRTPTPTSDGETPIENRRSLRERIQGWLGSTEYQPIGVARAQSSELRERPLLDVPVKEDGSGRVTLVLVFDLTGDSARQAFETMREDETARADVRERFRNRMASIAEQSAAVTDRSMRVHDAALELDRSEDGDTGVVRVSVAWEGLAALEDDHLVVTEPFASGFTPDREFRVRITAPEQYRVTTTRPDPVQQDSTSVAWAKGTDLDGFTLVFSPASRTPIPTDRIEELQPERTISPGDTNTGAPGFGAPVAILALLAVVFTRRRDR